MEKFLGDTVRISLETGIALAGYTTLRIKFKCPDGTIGAWTSLIDPVDGSVMYYDTLKTDLNMAGTWHIQAFAENTVARAHGKIVELEIFDTLTTTLAPTTAVP